MRITWATVMSLILSFLAEECSIILLNYNFLRNLLISDKENSDLSYNQL